MGDDQRLIGEPFRITTNSDGKGVDILKKDYLDTANAGDKLIISGSDPGNFIEYVCMIDKLILQQRWVSH